MKYTTEIYSSIESLPTDLLEGTQWEKNRYLETQFLQAMEACNTEEFQYLLLFCEGKVVFLSVLRIVPIVLNEGVLPGQEGSPLRKIALRYAEKTNESPLQFLVCGNLFLSGEHGYVLSENVDRKECLSEFYKALDQFVEQRNQIKFTLIKDFYTETDVDQIVLNENQYHKIQVDPTLSFTIDPQWDSMQDYLSAMKTKYRTKAKKAFKESDALKTKELNSKEIELLAPELHKLYTNVSKTNPFKMGTMNMQAYAILKEAYSKDFILRTYWLEDTLVGFMSAMKQGDELDAHYIGLDYDYNRKYYVYQRMLYDYIELGIQSKKTKINFGRTAGEIKSSIGATPEMLNCYIKHRSCFKNYFLRPISTIIKPSEFKLITPFKAKG